MRDIRRHVDELGIQQGDRVGVILPNGQSYIDVLHALGMIGAVPVLLNARLTPEEIQRQTTLIGCKTVIDQGEAGTGVLDLDSWGAFLTTEPHDDQIAAILFTSGTSGTPKAAQITYGNLRALADASADRLGVNAVDRWLLPLPLYHVGGLSIVFRSAVQGTKAVLPDDNTTQAIMRALVDERITHVSLVPTQVFRLLEAGFTPPPSLKLILVGGAAASPDLLSAAHARNYPIATTYGLTEATSQVATMLPEDVRAKPGSVGKPLKGMIVRIVDEQGLDQPPGVYGDIVISGAAVMKGYVSYPETGGVFNTGDIGYFDADGDLWLVQRRTDLIVSGGENVYPTEVEAVLRLHPSVAEACVVGISDAEWGERVAAAVILKNGTPGHTEAMIAFCRERLAGYKIPRYIRFVDSLPMTASGKIMRGAVRQLFAPDRPQA